MTQTTKTKILNIVRWALFLPASAIGSYIIYWLITLMWSENTPYLKMDAIWNNIVVVLGHLLMGGAFVLIGTNVAPKGERPVSIILFVIACIFCGLAVAGNILGNFSWYNLICEVGLLAGAIIALYLVNKHK